VRAAPGASGLGPGPERLDRPFSDPLAGSLFPPLASGVRWGLERTEQALAALGNPHHHFPVVHVGGTNGKGSVTTTVAAALGAAGLRVGCYTSPHLCSLRERIVVGGLALTEETLRARAAEMADVVARFGLTFFEAVTVLGFHAFAREGVDVAVIEVGLGGRLDATNVVRPLVSAVTNVQMDHADYLGGTLAEIAREKAGIVKAGVPFVLGETAPDLVAIFREVAARMGTPFHPVDAPARLRDVELARDHTAFTVATRAWGEVRLATPLVGLHQASNAVVAVEVLEHLPEGLRPGREALARGIAGVVHPGRDQIEVIEGRTWLFDVAHNTAGIQTLVDTLDRLDPPRPLVAVVGVLGDKDWPRMLPPLFSRADLAVLTQPPSAPPERRWDPGAVGAGLAGAGRIRVEEDFLAALAAAREAAGEGTVVVTGSCHTVGSALSALGREPLRRR
jgi:dihydrofolate synthase/folylpolyglutamate synthase